MRSTSEKAFESPNALRSSHRDLLDAARTSQGWCDVQFHLVEGLNVGHGKYAQVWTAEAQVGGRAVGRVVLKLFADAQWPLPHDYRDTWRPVGRRVSSELQAYAARRPTQGRDVAYCYGAYSFEMPWGDVVTGVVLEDLSRTAESIADFCKREKRNLSSVEDAYNVLSSSFRHLHRLHSLDVRHVQPRLDNILVLRESTSTEVQFVSCGFSWAESAAEGRRALRATEPDQLYRWGDECLLDGIWSLVLEWSVYVEWGEYAEEHEPGLVAWGGKRTEADGDSE